MKVLHSEVFLRRARFYAFHGVLPQERKVGGDFEVSTRVHYNICQASETDEVGSTLNYAELYELVRAQMSLPSQLLEHVAGRIAKTVFDTWKEADAVDVELVKLNPPMGADCDGAGVVLHAERGCS